MASFTWNPGADLRERYAGIDEWSLFLQGLGAEDYLAVFSQFVLRVQALPSRKQPRVFVSHRQADEKWGRRIVWLASRRAGLEYWLDVHDPLLRLAGNMLPPSDPRYHVVVAAIIEMALLNRTHVIAAHTLQSPGSKWIPYELGRAKGRAVISRQAAGWFETGVEPASCGEYVFLADIRRSDPAVEQWLVEHATKPIVPKPYPDSEPGPLP
jgi:hypothetical protein